MTSLDPTVADGIPTISCLHRPPWNPSKLTPHWFINQTAESGRDVYLQCLKKDWFCYKLSFLLLCKVVPSPEAHLRSVLIISLSLTQSLLQVPLSVMANIDQNCKFLKKRAAVNTQVGKKFCPIALGSTMKRIFFLWLNKISTRMLTLIFLLWKKTQKHTIKVI